MLMEKNSDVLFNMLLLNMNRNAGHHFLVYVKLSHYKLVTVYRLNVYSIGNCK